jgi:predicted secreted hydrolase
MKRPGLAVAVLAGLGLALGLAGLTFLLPFVPGVPAGEAAPGALGRALGEDAALAGFRRAEGRRSFRFPEDHGPHAGYRTEWWYWTGNLETADGRRFGYQLTFFRVALVPEPPAADGPWRSHAVFMAHLALTDPGAGRFHAHERFGREALALAGARAEPFAVWLDDWRVEGPTGTWPLTLRAAAGEVALELELGPGKGVVLQGEEGLSRKSAEHGNASWYYSMPRLPTRGRLRVAGREYGVTGESWLDREWSTSALAADQTGWDWFALQLEDGRELMFYRLRRQDGSMDPMSAGSLVARDGSVTRLAAGDVEFTETGDWRSPASGIRYPSGWRLAVPRLDLALEIRPLMPAQELGLSITYWEGAVDVQGRSAGGAIRGRGYVELAGYGG